ncbi:glycoside hydrolase family 18 protein [Coniophora puteana RWD-64-598 SS2]|uniref:chitinase n=1 Tax=Coniophora puteana (strain RWD-64-598) TaxID=741705 RepID=A0A5M3MKN6_CONPW|nr:glycoside hydrolase family 18 protein [Coniophora puteana RWD-64-598 SS2]EIW79384.1 glycoside hydrolase family 18 protein [Coniophora puteana RWD-64-598 SS2]
MVFFGSFSTLFTAVISATAAVALPVKSTNIAKRATPAAPHFVIYSDKWVSGETGPPAVSDITGYNVFALSFWLTSGPADQAIEWTELDNATRASIKSDYNSAGISLIVSAFGSTDAPTSSGDDPTTTANNLAAWVIEYGLDGVDIDYEDFNAINAEDGSAETWLSTFTTALRAKLPAGDYILTHAPVAPWFSTKYTSGAYLKVNENVGSLIDWYNVQFYNQGTTEYTTCDGLLTASSTTYPNSALFQIAASGVSLDKLVIGKPADSGDATNGYMDPTTLAGCLETAKGQNWDAGVMVWEYPDAAASWIETVRSVAFPE